MRKNSTIEADFIFKFKLNGLINIISKNASITLFLKKKKKNISEVFLTMKHFLKTNFLDVLEISYLHRAILPTGKIFFSNTKIINP